MDDKNILQHLLEIRDGQARLETKVDSLQRTVSGNGQPGIIQKLEALEAEKSRLRGIGAAIIGLWAIFEYLYHYLGGHHGPY